MEAFYTIQGEGFNTGTPAYFIRLGGCDVGCVWCDVKDSWDSTRHPMTPVETIVQDARASGADTVVVTGGEPLMHTLDALCATLRKNKFRIFLETSGTGPLSGQWDWICVSPKKFKTPGKEVLEKADELKVIVFNTSDFAWAEKQAGFVRKACKLYLQPEWERAAGILPEIITYVKKNPRWSISLQTHKYIHIP